MSRNPVPEAGAPRKPSVFLSHSKSPAGSEALAMSYELDRNHVKNFLDSNDLAHLTHIAPKVKEATHFFLLMSKYDANDETMRFGPFSRYFCLIEILTWFLCRDEVQAVVVEIEQDGFGTSTFPDSQQAVDGLLKEADWAKLCEEIPNAKELVLQASLALMGLPRFKWSPTDLSRSPAQLAALLAVVGVDTPAVPQLPQRAAVRLSVLCSKEGAVEAALIARAAQFEFPHRVDARINSDWENDHSVVLLTPDVLNDLAVLTRIASVKSPVLVTVSRPGLGPFPFEKQPTVGDDELKKRFAETVQYLAKELSPHSTTPIVQVQMRLIWEGVGLKDLANLFPNVPYLGDPYSVAVSKAKSFAPGTGKWLFAKLEEWNRDKNMAFVLSGTGGLGKSVLAGELCARYSLAVAARAGRQAVETELPFVVAALHFFKHDDTRLNSTLAAIGSIARQLAENIDGFYLLLEDAVKTRAKGQLEDPKTLFRACILEPAKKAVSNLSSSRVLIVLDALDECADQNVLFPLLAELWPEMPSAFGLVVTTRPGVEVPKLNKFKPYTFEPAENERSGDIELFVKHTLGDKATPVVVDTVRKNAAGLFIYAMFACKQLLECGDDNLDEAVRSLPVSMDATYVEYFTRFRKGLANEDFYLVVLAPILASRVPLPEKVWRETCMPEIVPEGNSGTRLAKKNADNKFDKLVIAPLANLLDFSGGTVKVLHKTMDDFLRSSEEANSHSLVVDVPVGHELIATKAEGFAFRNPTWEPLTGDEERFYGAHSLCHLTEAGMLGGASKQVLEMDRLMRLVWAAKQDSSFARLIRDVQALSQVADNPKIQFALSLLNLSERAVTNDPREFAGQVLGRVMIAPFSEVQLFWINQAQEWIKRASGKGQLEIMVPICFGRSGLQPAGTSLLKVLKGHTHQVLSVAISPDSRFIVTGSYDKTARVWDFATGEERRVFKGHTNWVNSVAISPDSRFIVTGSGDNTARVWDFETGEKRWVLKGYGGVTSVAISPDARFIVTGSDDKTARVWDAQTGEEKRALEGHTNKVTSVAISPDSRFIVTGSDDKTVRVWDFETGEERRVLEGHTNWVTSVAISSDSRCIVAGSMDKTVRVWDVATGEESRVLKVHINEVNPVAISPDSRFIVTGFYDNTARLWDAQTGEGRRVLKGHIHLVSSVAISPDSRFIVTGSMDNTARVWDFATGEETRVSKGHTDKVNSVAFSPNFKFIVTGSVDYTARVWGFATGEKRWVLKGHYGSVTSLAISPDSRFIVTGSRDKTARVWDVATGEERMVLEEHAQRVDFVAISPDSKFIVTGSDDKTARVWDAQTGNRKWVLEGHSSRVTSVAISPDSKFIVTGSWDKTARVWDFATGEERIVLEGHTDKVTSVAISPDSQFIVTGSQDETARVWDAQTGKKKMVLKGYTWGLISVTISPDSRFIVTVSVDKTALVWDFATGLQSQLNPHKCGFASQTVDGSVTLGALNTVGFTQDSHEHVKRVGAVVFGKRENDYECWALSTQSQCLLPVADSDLPPSKRLKQSD